jgi:hypothetical protein
VNIAALALRVRLTGAFLLIAVIAIGLVAIAIRRVDVSELREASLERERAFMVEGLRGRWGRLRGAG